jgi:small subunit ribosomal protein S5
MAKPEKGPNEEGKRERKGRGGERGEGGGERRRKRDDKEGGEREGSELVERLVAINRVAKVVKGGRRFGFAALVVVGDGRGKIGAGAGKAREVPEAIKKATDQAKRRMVRVPLRDGRTIHHDIEARFGAGRVRLRAAVPGTGIIAGGPLRAVFEVLGIQDVVAKSLGSSNPYNMVKAALEAFKHMESPRMVAGRRGRRVNEVLGRKGDAKEKSDE